jgi:hypothetical protein
MPASLEQANGRLLAYMMAVLEDGRFQSAALYGRLRWSYWLLVSLTVVVFCVGLALLASPLWLPRAVGADSTIGWYALVLPPALGIANLLGLYLYQPMRRINTLMGTMTQLIVVLNQYHIRVALHLVEARLEDRPTLGVAADSIRTVASYSLNAIQNYFGRVTKDEQLASTTSMTPATGAGANSNPPAPN